jgi:hypothetical protein
LQAPHISLAPVTYTISPSAVNPLEYASYWARELGCSEKSLVKLRGGINNHVYRCGANQKLWVIKGYPIRQNQQRDRMQAEVDFLRYAHEVAPGRVPELLTVDIDRRCVVLEHIQGTPYHEGISPNDEDVQAAIEFFRQLNADLNLAQKMIKMDAAEGFLSLSQHLANVRQRLAAMDAKHLPTELRSQAIKLLANLQDITDHLEGKLETQIAAGEIVDDLDPGLRCISPSDFGFHNAILTSLGIKFIDFEFAGWDDPTKTCIDFQLQPKVPIKRYSKDLSTIIAKDKNAYIQHRRKTLLPILEAKWLCIVLAILQQERLESIISQQPGINSTLLIQARLIKAKKWLVKSEGLSLAKKLCKYT